MDQPQYYVFNVNQNLYRRINNYFGQQNSAEIIKSQINLTFWRCELKQWNISSIQNYSFIGNWKWPFLLLLSILLV